jgi:predicted enzyme related to lactoylglutathione lyase
LSAVPTFLAIAPILPTADVARMQTHYELLGFVVHVHQSGYATATRDDIKLHFHLTADHDPMTQGGAVYISVDDADALHAEWSAAGVDALDDLWDPGFGVWEAAHTDPDGNKIRFGSPVREGARP